MLQSAVAGLGPDHSPVLGVAGTDVNVAVIGASGRIGRRVIDLVAQWRGTPSLRIVAAANSSRIHDGCAGQSAEAIAASLAAAPRVASAHALDDVLRRLPRPLIAVDCTASASVAAAYPRWLGAGIDLVSANKLAPSAGAELRRAIATAQAGSSAGLHYSTTVGAQLPILSTLRELAQAGDRIERLEAVLSGTLSFVLGRAHQGVALSAAIREAVASGYAEPHPGRDLSGEDAARKLVIALRAIGHEIDLEDIERVPLVEESLLGDADACRLLERIGEADETWRARSAIAQARRERWVYRASFENGRARVAPERLPASHPLADVAPCENAFILHSRYYSAAPLCIRGPGAGIELTATGVFADLLAAARLCHVTSVAPSNRVPDEVAAVA